MPAWMMSQRISTSLRLMPRGIWRLSKLPFGPQITGSLFSASLPDPIVHPGTVHPHHSHTFTRTLNPHVTLTSISISAISQLSRLRHVCRPAPC